MSKDSVPLSFSRDKRSQKMNIISSLRHFAQTLRHAPGLRSCKFIWRLLRQPYLWVLTLFASKSGIEVHVGGFPVLLHPAFSTAGWESCEFECYRIFASELHTGSVVYDVGAHIGTYTLVALQNCGPSGRVVAYEPDDFTRQYLLQHLKWNGGENRTIVRPCCCGETSGIADLYHVPEKAEGMNSLLPIAGFHKKSVLVTTLDEEVAKLGLIPALIKIDVEGWEWQVLKGAESTLQRYGPRLLLSLHPQYLENSGTSAESVLVWLQQKSYQYKVIGQDHEIHVFCWPIRPMIGTGTPT